MSWEQDAVREWAWNYGALHPDQEWINSPLDSWEQNPHYIGKPGRHPEDDYEDDETFSDPKCSMCKPLPVDLSKKVKKRKFLKYDDLKAHANKMFRESLNEYTEGRHHIATFVSDLLIKADQYKGFRYLTADESLPGHLPGIVFNEKPNNDGRFFPNFPDHTRIQFY